MGDWVVHHGDCRAVMAGKAAMREGMRFVGIEQDASYVDIARARIGHEAEKHSGLLARAGA